MKFSLCLFLCLQLFSQSITLYFKDSSLEKIHQLKGVAQAINERKNLLFAIDFPKPAKSTKSAQKLISLIDGSQILSSKFSLQNQFSFQWEGKNFSLPIQKLAFLNNKPTKLSKIKNPQNLSTSLNSFPHLKLNFYQDFSLEVNIKFFRGDNSVFYLHINNGKLKVLCNDIIALLLEKNNFSNFIELSKNSYPLLVVWSAKKKKMRLFIDNKLLFSKTFDDTNRANIFINRSITTTYWGLTQYPYQKVLEKEKSKQQLVKLNNSDFIKGKIYALDYQKIYIKETLGQYDIALNAVKEIFFHNPTQKTNHKIELFLQSGEKIYAQKILAVDENHLKITNSILGEISIALKNLKLIVFL